MARQFESTAARIPKRVVIATLAAAVAAVVVLIAISAAGGGGDGSSGPLTGAAQVAAELNGLPQAAATLGNPNAAVEIVEYADMQCPFCAEASTEIVPQLIERYVERGVAKLTLRPMAFIGPDSQTGALALAAAAEQNMMWNWSELAYRNQGGENDGWLSDDFAGKVAKAAGLDVEAFDAARRSDDAKRFLDDAGRAAQAAGVQSTPTFVVTGRRGSVVIDDYRNLAAFDAAFASVR